MLADIYAIAGVTAVFTLLITWLAVFVGLRVRKMITGRTLGKQLKYRGTLKALVAAKGSGDD